MTNTKQDIYDLAIFGGKPLFDEQLHVGKPNIGNKSRLMQYLNKILDEGWLTNNGPLVREFEKEIGDYLGAKNVIATCNGTVALELVIRALELKGEVILPSFTFIATAHALQWQEITPIFCDIDPQTHCIDPDRIEMMITPRTSAIIGVHIWGRPANIPLLNEIAEHNNLKIIYDASHAFGASYREKMIGNFGQAEVFSFHATKFLNTFEGGAIVTNDDDLASKLRLMKNFGFSGYDNVIYIGTNGKMSEVSAAMGLTGFENIEKFISHNYKNYKYYQKELDGIPGLQLASYNERDKNNYQYIVFEIDEHTTGIHRDELVNILHSENVLARRYFYPGCHNMEPYRSCFPHSGLLLPETERVLRRNFLLPTGMAINKEKIVRISELIRFIVENGRKVNRYSKESAMESNCALAN